MILLALTMGLFLYLSAILFSYQDNGEGQQAIMFGRNGAGDVPHDMKNNVADDFGKESKKEPNNNQPDNVPVMPNNVPVPRCPPKKRIELLKKECGTTSLTLDQLTPLEKSRILNNIYVDEKHKILACIPPKSGCSTWKTILANNTYDDPLPKGFRTHSLHFGVLQSRFHIYSLLKYNASMREHMLTSDEYFRFMIARHPFERLYSAYYNKLVSGIDTVMLRNWGKRILDRFHPDLPEAVRKAGKGVKFEEFVRILKEPNTNNPHWEPVVNLCQPCLVNYDYIVKTETMDEDNEPIINEHLLPYRRGLHTADNVVAGGPRQTSLTSKGREIEEYQGLSEEDLKFVEDRFEQDLRYFGYSWKTENSNSGTGPLFSSCTHGAHDKICC